jgi:uncharacterized membrane protein (DUF373 family)
MSNPNPPSTPSQPTEPTEPTSASLTPLRSLSGALIAVIFALLLYRLTASVVQSFAAHPSTSSNTVVLNLSAAVRTLVIGSMTLATGIFSVAALGLVGLAVQLTLQHLTRPKLDS